jgi:hypothetical protein
VRAHSLTDLFALDGSLKAESMTSLVGTTFHFGMISSILTFNDMYSYANNSHQSTDKLHEQIDFVQFQSGTEHRQALYIWRQQFSLIKSMDL